MKIAILGAGAFGTALGGILADKGYDIDYYDNNLEREKLSKVLDGAKLILLVVPSFVVTRLLPHLPTDIPMIVATKGILNDAVFSDFKDVMILSGPGFADDIKSAKPTRLTATDNRIVEMFSTNYLSFDFTTDIKGVLMCGALKNVYALRAGMLGLQRDSKPWADYIEATAKEMKEILVLNGADARTVDLSCGKPDLMLTAGLPSRNYEFGTIIRTNPDYQPEKTVEGLSTIRKILHHEISIPDSATIMHDILEYWSAKWA